MALRERSSRQRRRADSNCRIEVLQTRQAAPDEEKVEDSAVTNRTGWRRLLGTTPGSIFAWIFAGSAQIAFVARNIRGYALCVPALLACFFLLCELYSRTRNDRDLKNDTFVLWTLYALCASAALYSHLLSGIVLFVFGMTWLIVTLREKLSLEYEWKIQELTFQKDQLEQKVNSAGTGGAVAANGTDLSEEIAGVEEQVAELTRFIDNPTSALSAVIRKNVKRAELEAYRRGLSFRMDGIKKE